MVASGNAVDKILRRVVDKVAYGVVGYRCH